MKNERELGRIKTTREIGEILSGSMSPWEKVILLIEQYGKINQTDSNGSGKNIGWKSLEQTRVKGKTGSYTMNLNQAPLLDENEKPISGQFEKSVELFVTSYLVSRTPSVTIDKIYYIDPQGIKDGLMITLVGDELLEVSHLIDTFSMLLLRKKSYK